MGMVSYLLVLRLYWGLEDYSTVGACGWDGKAKSHRCPQKEQ